MQHHNQIKVVLNIVNTIMDLGNKKEKITKVCKNYFLLVSEAKRSACCGYLRLKAI